MSLLLCFLPREPSVRHFTAEGLLGAGDRGREGPIRSASDNHQIHVAAGVGLSLCERTEEKGELDIFEWTQGLQQNGVGCSSPQDKALKIFVKRMLPAKGVPDLVPNSLGIEKLHSLKPAEVPEKVTCRLVKDPPKLTDVKCFTGV